MESGLTQRGVVFWPVGTGDSTTIVVDDKTVVQVDIHDLVKADEDGTPETAVVDRLIEALPERNGRPYLSVFVLTHADLDHCCGFEDLLAEVTIGELWATPRLWRELEDEDASISKAAAAFHEEADRRVTATLESVGRGEQPVSGDRVRIIGHDTDKDLYGYADLPDEYLSFPGQSVSVLDGVDCGERFEAFIHAPFKDDCARARNDTSVAMQVTLRDGPGTGQFLLFGDLAYETLIKIFDYSTAHGRQDRVVWDVLLAPHHCSKKVMYVGDDLKQEMLDAFDNNGRAGSTVVSSSATIPTSDTPGANPPHHVAAERYKTVADDFRCTMEHGSLDAPSPVVFEVDSAGLRLLDPELVTASAATVEKAAASASRLRSVALAAARYGAGRTPPLGRAGARAASLEEVRTAIREQRAGESAPSGVVGFGRE